MGLLSTIGAASGRAFGFTRSAIAAATDAFFNRVTLLLPGNGTNGAQNNTFLDSSTNNFTITRNGNTTQGTFSPFSQTGWSNYFPNTYLSAAANNAFSFGTGNFTIEAWVYPTVGSVYRGIFANGGASTGSFAVYLTNGDTVRLDYYGGGGVGTTTTVALNTWSHIVVARSGSTISIFINGTRQATTTTSDNNTSNACYVGASWGGASDYMQGYMSNLRVVKGTAVYDPTQSTLTVPTAPLTAVTNTSLLTCQSNRFIDNSTNAFAITVNGTPSVQAFSPFAPTAAYSAATNGGSGYFDGSGDYVTWPSGSSVAFGTGDFTVETFFYLTTTPAGSLYFIDARDASNTTAWAFHIAGATSIIWFNGSAQFAVTLTMPINQWNHIAYVRSGTTGALYFNGTRVSTQTDSTNYTVQPGTSYVASRYTANETFPGYFSGTRIVKGTAAYSGTTYTVPTAPLTAITNTTLLLNYTNAGITDATAKNVLETVGNAQISTTQSKFGGSSMYFDGTGDSLSAPSSVNYQFGSGNFTIEGWVNFSSVSGEKGIVSYFSNSPSNAGFTLRLSTGNSPSGLRFVASTGGGTDIILQSAWTPSTGTWYHFAVVRNGTTVTAYIDGTSIGSTTMNITVGVPSAPLVVGTAQTVASSDMNGYIDDLRITKGYARYTANFSAPSAAFPLQ